MTMDAVIHTSAFAQRFMRYVEFEPNSGCWLWSGCAHSRGYGRIIIRNKVERAHRVSYAMAHGDISDLHIDHLCRTPACVNPSHLELVTQAENNRRAPHHNSLRTHCKRGHALIGANLLFESTRNKRVCRACKRMRERFYKTGRKVCV